MLLTNRVGEEDDRPDMPWPASPTEPDLTLKQQRWINAYLETGNATEAARVAGYNGSEGTLRSIGSENLTKLNIRRRIEARIEESGIEAREVTGILASQARIDPTEAFEPGQNQVVDRLREKGLGHWLKAITTKRHIEGKGDDAHEVEVERIEFHSSFSAAAQLSKNLGIEKQPATNPEDTKWNDVAESLALKYGLPVEQVKRDMAAKKPELASVLVQ